MKLTEAIERLAIATRANGRSPRTVDSYREKLGHLANFLEDPPVEGVTVHELRSFVVAQLDSGLSPFTVKSRVRALKRLFNFCQEEGIRDDNPGQAIKTPNPKRDAPKGIKWADFLALLETTRPGDLLDLRDRALMLFLFDTACRVGGLTWLEVDDLDLEARRAVVTEKRGQTRPVFYQQATAEALRDWLRVRPSDRGPWVFTSSKVGYGRLTGSGVRHLLDRRAEEAGCEGPTNPHAFRHGFARAYLLGGGDLGTLSDIMGHSSVAITKEFYAVFTTDELQRQHDRYSPIAQLEGGENDEA
jgi:integrase/recombinase XerD